MNLSDRIAANPVARATAEYLGSGKRVNAAPSVGALRLALAEHRSAEAALVAALDAADTHRDAIVQAANAAVTAATRAANGEIPQAAAKSAWTAFLAVVYGA